METPIPTLPTQQKPRAFIVVEEMPDTDNPEGQSPIQQKSLMQEFVENRWKTRTFEVFALMLIVILLAIVILVVSLKSAAPTAGL